MTAVSANNDFLRLGSLRLSLSSRKARVKQMLGSSSAPTSPNNEQPVKFTQDQGLSRIEIPEVVHQEDESVGSCVITVGSTGTGKSSTISKYTGSRTKSGSGHERVTKQCEIHRSLTNDSEAVWVDTVGWDDVEIEDDETFKDILKFIDKYNITKVKAVIWNISPNVRRDALLSGQARLIDLFKRREIWNNVIIVAKQSLNPETDCQGALHAAEVYTDRLPLYTGYRFFSDPTISPQQRDKFTTEEARNLFNVKTDEEVREILSDLLGQIGPPVQVVFKTKRCVNCSVSGDPRLLPSHCHMEAQHVHLGRVENHHPGGQEKYHPTQTLVFEHNGRLRKRWYANVMCGSMRKPRYTCCGRRNGKQGCKEKWACCRKEKDDVSGCTDRYRCCGASVSFSNTRTGCSPRYSCCLKEIDRLGCRKVCKKCGKDWGSPPDGCFRKEHELVDINAKLASETPSSSARAEDAEGIDAAADSEDRLRESEGDSFLRQEGRESAKQKHKFKNFRQNLSPVITYHVI